MMFMQFRLGYDMGIILVKAIILSLISVFFLMPGVLLILQKELIKPITNAMYQKLRL